MTETKQPCPRCGGRDGIMTADQAAETAMQIPVEPSLRAAGEVYRARLECCASCTSLIEGVLCLWCGCFVQFRAQFKTGSCPSPSGDKWQQLKPLL